MYYVFTGLLWAWQDEEPGSSAAGHAAFTPKGKMTYIYIIFFRSSHTALKQTQINSLNVANNNSRDYCEDFEVCVCCNM